ncbi:MAG: hypothetical protein VX834_12655 [Myxococcota bacterium]|nr:hypothetical protein [Myxococcota bacterium]
MRLGVTWLGLGLLGAMLVTSACTRTAQKPQAVAEDRPAAERSSSTTKGKDTPLPQSPQPQDVIVKVEERKAAERDMAEAQKKLAEARHLFTRGRYERAEVLLKDAITLFPFVPEANLLLGKIFLIRGAANRDLTMMDNAWLMFEMAKAMEPENREVTTLLELFRTRRID